jgi:hypothetical protein
MASSVIFLVVPIHFLQKAISLVKNWIMVSSGDGRETVNFCTTCVQPRLVEALSSRSLSTSHISTGWSISSMSGRSPSLHPRCVSSIALLARSC